MIYCFYNKKASLHRHHHTEHLQSSTFKSCHWCLILQLCCCYMFECNAPIHLLYNEVSESTAGFTIRLPILSWVTSVHGQTDQERKLTQTAGQWNTSYAVQQQCPEKPVFNHLLCKILDILFLPVLTMISTAIFTVSKLTNHQYQSHSLNLLCISIFKKVKSDTLFYFRVEKLVLLVSSSSQNTEGSHLRKAKPRNWEAHTFLIFWPWSTWQDYSHLYYLQSYHRIVVKAVEP